LPGNSIFTSLAEASKFFETGSTGYSAAKDGKHLDGLILETKKWRVDAIDLEFVRSSFYENETVFPKGKVEFDHALVMRDIKHEWHSAPNFKID
jgi:hypothetical protein